MKFGYFDDQKREYVITEPRTPLPWINYLGSDGFFRLSFCSSSFNRLFQLFIHYKSSSLFIILCTLTCHTNPYPQHPNS